MELPRGITPLILAGDVLARLADLPDESIHCVVTSPPYWRLRDYSRCDCAQFVASEVGSSTLAGGGNAHLPNHNQNKAADPTCVTCHGTGVVPGVKEQQLGLEEAPTAFVSRLVAVFREVRRVLRSDGVCFLNVGDSQVTNWGSVRPEDGAGIVDNDRLRNIIVPPGYKLLDEVGSPDLLVAALRADGWYRRATIIWAKGRSGEVNEIPEEEFSDAGPGNVMPSPDSGWRWEPHRVFGPKDNGGKRKLTPCPGCAKCTPNGGLVLRKQAWKPTKTHEYVYMLTKTDEYYCDRDAAAEDYASPEQAAHNLRYAKPYATFDDRAKDTGQPGNENNRGIHSRPGTNGRNLRSVLFINPHGYSGAHYATFPERLVEPFIKVATSERGACSECGSQWARIIEREKVYGSWREHLDDRVEGNATDPALMLKGDAYYENYKAPQTVGWKATCGCGAPPIPAIVLDPFAGSGTTLAVAKRLRRRSIGIELSPVSVRLAEKRVAETIQNNRSLIEFD